MCFVCVEIRFGRTCSGLPNLVGPCWSAGVSIGQLLLLDVSVASQRKANILAISELICIWYSHVGMVGRYLERTWWPLPTFALICFGSLITPSLQQIFTHLFCGSNQRRKQMIMNQGHSKWSSANESHNILCSFMFINELRKSLSLFSLWSLLLLWKNHKRGTEKSI